MTDEGYIQPDESCLKQMFFRKPGLPILMVEFPDGRRVPYWNTVYQEVHGREYLGQMDLNIKSEKVWDFYRETLEKIADVYKRQVHSGIDSGFLWQDQMSVQVRTARGRTGTYTNL